MTCAEGAEKNFCNIIKKFPKPCFSAELELRGEGGRGSRGEAPPPPGMKSIASPCPNPPPGGGVGTLGQIAPNQTNPPTHRPQTHPPTPPPSPWGRITLKQKSGGGDYNWS